MISLDRKKLPYRKNCEGYFIFDGKILAQGTKKGYVLFPGGGLDEGEDPESALIRETFEETGAVVINLKKLGVLHFDLGEKWAQTEKQRRRYEKYRGEEMHLFSGEIKEFEKPEGDLEDEWKGEKLMLIREVIDLIRENGFSGEEIDQYYKFQIKILEKLKC